MPKIMIINFKKGDIVEILPKITRNWNDQMIASIGKTFEITSFYGTGNTVGVTINGKEWKFEPDGLKLIEDIKFTPNTFTESGKLDNLSVAKFIYTPNVKLLESKIIIRDLDEVTMLKKNKVRLNGFRSCNLYNGLSWTEIEQTIYLDDIVYSPSLNNFGKVISFVHNKWKVRFYKDTKAVRLMQGEDLIKSHELSGLIKQARDFYPEGTKYINLVEGKECITEGHDFDFYNSGQGYGKTVYEIHSKGLIYKNNIWAQKVTSTAPIDVVKITYPEGTYYHCLERETGETGYIGRATSESESSSDGISFLGSGFVHRDYRYARKRILDDIKVGIYVQAKYKICIGASALSKAETDMYNSPKVFRKIGIVKYINGDSLCTVEFDGVNVKCPIISLSNLSDFIFATEAYKISHTETEECHEIPPPEDNSSPKLEPENYIDLSIKKSIKLKQTKKIILL